MHFVWKRLIGVVPSLIGVIIVTFLLSRALPGDPAAYFAGPAANAESIAAGPRNSSDSTRASRSNSCSIWAILAAAIWAIR